MAKKKTATKRKTAIKPKTLSDKSSTNPPQVLHKSSKVSIYKQTKFFAEVSRTCSTEAKAKQS